MTLQEYVAEREHVVLFWTSIACRNGEYESLGYDLVAFAEGHNLNGLEGTVDKDDQWHWDGEGEPRDMKNSTILRAMAYVDKAKWDQLVEEFESQA